MPSPNVHVVRIRTGLEAIPSLLEPGVNAHSTELKAWKERLNSSLVTLYGDDHPQLNRFRRLRFWQARSSPRGYTLSWTHADQEIYADALARAEQLLRDVLEEFPDSSTHADESVPWSTLHHEIVSVARGRYEAGHLANAVEAALKHVNSVVKERVIAAGGQELDGATLMQTAFSPKGPILCLDDLSTESGRNVQQGYMQIYAGAMTGIRNPKAHANVSLSPERALHLLFLASLLRGKLDSP